MLVVLHKTRYAELASFTRGGSKALHSKEKEKTLTKGTCHVLAEIPPAFQVDRCFFLSDF